MKIIPGFIGVFSSDNCPLLTKKKTGLIMNFDKQNEPGSHFIAFFLNDKNECLYFDSLDIPIIPFTVDKYILNYNTIFDYSIPVQSFNSSYCGFYCMLFISSMFVNEKYYENIFSKFFKQSIDNDKKCISYLCKVLLFIKKKIINKQKNR